MKLVMNSYTLSTKCKICTKIDEKQTLVRQEEEKIRGKSKEATLDAKNSIEEAERNICQLKLDVEQYRHERNEKRCNLSWEV